MDALELTRLGCAAAGACTSYFPQRRSVDNSEDELASVLGLAVARVLPETGNDVALAFANEHVAKVPTATGPGNDVA